MHSSSLPIQITSDDEFTLVCRNNPRKTPNKTTLKTPKFNGEFANQYEMLANEMVKTLSREHLNLKGDFSPQKHFYFPESPELIDIVKEFSSAFWASRKNIDLSNRNPHKSKLDTMPNLGFILAEINNRKICFVSLSGTTTLNKDGALHLKRFINDKYSEVNGVTFTLVTCGLDNFNLLLARITEAKKMRRADNSEKSCSEKYLMATLTKIILQHTDVKVLSMVNIEFYLHFDHIKSHTNSAQKIAVNAHPSLPTQFKSYEKFGPMHVMSRCACTDCQANKGVIKLIFAAAKQISEYSSMFSTSPLNNSILNTSLLPFLFASKKPYKKLEKSNPEIIESIHEEHAKTLKDSNDSVGSDFDHDDSLIDTNDLNLSVLAKTTEKVVLSHPKYPIPEARAWATYACDDKFDDNVFVMDADIPATTSIADSFQVDVKSDTEKFLALEQCKKTDHHLQAFTVFQRRIEPAIPQNTTTPKPHTLIKAGQ